MTSLVLAPAQPRDRSVAPPKRHGSPADRHQTNRDPLVLGALFFVFYGAVGWWLRDVVGFIIGDALSRTANAIFVIAGRDPHMGAIGFYWPPLSSFVELPFVLVLKHFGRADLAGPISTALCMAAAVVVVAYICRFLGLGRVLTIVVAVLFGLNPVIVFSAANGMSEASAYLMLCIGMLGFFRYCRGRRPTDMAIMATGLAFVAMARVEAILFGVVVIAVATIDFKDLPRSVPRSVARASVGVLPVIYLFALWMAVQAVLLRDPLFFIHVAAGAGNGQATAQSLANGVQPTWYMLPQARDKLAVARWVVLQYWFYGPALFFAPFLALLRWKQAREPLAILLGATCFVAVQVDFRFAGRGYQDPRYFGPLAVMATMLVAWTLGEIWGTPALSPAGDKHLSSVTSAPPASPRPGAALWARVKQAGASRRKIAAKTSRIVLSAALLATMVLGAVTATVAEANPKRAKVVREDTFFARLLGRDRPYVFAGDWVAWHNIATTVDAVLAKGHHRIICDPTWCFPLVTLTHHPEDFIVSNDRDWQPILADPTNKFDLALTFTDPGSTSTGSAGDDVVAPLLYPPSDWKLVDRRGMSSQVSNIKAYLWMHTGGTAAGTNTGPLPSAPTGSG